MKRVLVIGGAGYIGSHVARFLLDKGCQVTIFDNLSTGREENIFPGVAFVKGDIRDEDHLDEIMKKGFDSIVHLAALKSVGASMTKIEEYSDVNLVGTLNILNTALRNNIKSIVFSSSAAVYGEPEYIPMDEEHPKKPMNYYGFTKLEIERILEWYCKLKGMKFAALRYFNAVGYDIEGRVKGLERNPENLMPLVMEVASGKREKLTIFGGDYDTEDGTCIRDYIHVNDLAEAHWKAINYLDENESLIVNLGSEEGISVLQMVEATEKIIGKKLNYDIGPRREGDPAKLYASSKKAKELLDWEAKHSDVDSIIKSMWEVYKD